MLKISSSHIKNNFNIIQKKIGNRIIWPVIKSNAYNMGLVPIANILSENCNCSNFIVATIEEGKILRSEKFLKEKILILQPLIPNEKDILDIIHHSLIPTIENVESIMKLNIEAYKKNIAIDVHLNIDTGMGRFGFLFDDFIYHLPEILNCKNINIKGIYSHFSSSSDPNPDSISYTKKQIARYQNLLNQISEKVDLKSITKHLANSGGILNYPESYFDAVRPGILIYGVYPNPKMTPLQNDFKEAIHWISHIISIRKIKKNSYIGYDRKYLAKKDMIIGIVPIGYALGYSTLLSNIGYVIYKEKKISTIAKVAMDSLILDLSEVEEISLKDEVTILGNNQITFSEIANLTNDLPHNILTRIYSGIKKAYI